MITAVIISLLLCVCSTLAYLLRSKFCRKTSEAVCAAVSISLLCAAAYVSNPDISISRLVILVVVPVACMLLMFVICGTYDKHAGRLHWSGVEQFCINSTKCARAVGSLSVIATQFTILYWSREVCNLGLLLVNFALILFGIVCFQFSVIVDAKLESEG